MVAKGKYLVDLASLSARLHPDPCRRWAKDHSEALGCGETPPRLWRQPTCGIQEPISASPLLPYLRLPSGYLARKQAVPLLGIGVEKKYRRAAVASFTSIGVMLGGLNALFK